MSSAANECVPRYRPGDQITVTASAAVTGKRFVKVSNGHEAGPALNTSTSGGNIRAAHADEGDYAIGIANKDAAQGEKFVAVGLRGGEFPVTADGTVTAGDKVQVGAAGKAKKLDTTAVAAVSASGTTGVVASNNALTYTARDAGSSGNGISIQLKDPAGNSQSLSVTVNGNDIVVNLATDSEGEITSTASLVKSAIEGSAGANSLVSVAHTGASTGAGVVAAVAATNLTGGRDAGPGVMVGIATTSATDGQDVYVLRQDR